MKSVLLSLLMLLSSLTGPMGQYIGLTNPPLLQEIQLSES